MPNAPKLLTAPDGQPKAVKGQSENVLTAVMHLAPANLAGRGDVCAHRTTHCTDLCLNIAGRGGILAGSLDDIRARHTNAIQLARIARTERFFDNSRLFLDDLAKEIRAHVRRADKLGMRPAVRLNGTSDIPWERVAPGLFAEFPDLTYYDYTKYPIEKRPADRLPANYSLTMSYSGENADACADALDAGRNVAMVFAIKKGRPLPKRFGYWPVIDGDLTDLRFLDPSPCIVGLRLKGRWTDAALASPFVVTAPFTSVKED